MEVAYSTNGEEFIYMTASEALEALASAELLTEGYTYYEHDVEIAPFSRYLCAENVLEAAGDKMYEEIGEAAEDAFYATDEAVKELNALLDQWADKHLNGVYWRCVGEERELHVTAADVAEYGEQNDD